MKKTIQITIANRLFQIEEDAYDALEAYLNSLTTHFRDTDPDGEILHDFEARISELFEERRRVGHSVITMAIVNDTISQIGDSSQLFDDEADGSPRTDTTSSTTSSTESRENIPKRLYRNPDDKVLSGTLGGLAAYLNIDSNLLRLLFVIVIIAFKPTLFLILVYIAAALFLPKAVTPEQKLELKGKAFSVSSVWHEIQESIPVHSSEKQGGTSQKKSSTLRYLFGIIGVAILIWLVYHFFNRVDADLMSLPAMALMGLGLSGVGLKFWPFFIAGIILIVAFIYLIAILPIGLILKSKSSGLIKILLILLWFVVLYSISYL